MGIAGAKANLAPRHEGSAPSMCNDDFPGVLGNPGWFGVGSRVLCTKNEWKDASLCNGTQGTVLHLVFDPLEGDKPGALPTLIVQWDKEYIGPSFLKDSERVTPLVPRSIPHKTAQGVFRYGIPVRLAHGVSIGKVQGMTSEAGLSCYFGRDNSRFVCSEYIAITRCRRHGPENGLLMRKAVSFERMQEASNFAGGAVKSPGLNYLSRKAYFCKQVGRFLATLTREAALVESLMKFRGEEGGLAAKVREVEDWAAGQTSRIGGEGSQLGVAGVYYMFMDRTDMPPVSSRGVRGRRRSVVIDKDDKNVLYRARPPTNDRDKRAVSATLENVYGISENWRGDYPLSHLKKGDVLIFICQKPFMGPSVLIVEDASADYVEEVPEAAWFENGPLFESWDTAKAWYVDKFPCDDCRRDQAARRTMLTRNGRAKRLAWVRFRPIDDRCAQNQPVFQCCRPGCWWRFASEAELLTHQAVCRSVAPASPDDAGVPQDSSADAPQGSTGGYRLDPSHAWFGSQHARGTPSNTNDAHAGEEAARVDERMAEAKDSAFIVTESPLDCAQSLADAKSHFRGGTKGSLRYGMHLVTEGRGDGDGDNGDDDDGDNGGDDDDGDGEGGDDDDDDGGEGGGGEDDEDDDDEDDDDEDDDDDGDEDGDGDDGGVGGMFSDSASVERELAGHRGRPKRCASPLSPANDKGGFGGRRDRFGRKSGKFVEGPGLMGQKRPAGGHPLSPAHSKGLSGERSPDGSRKASHVAAGEDRAKMAAAYGSQFVVDLCGEVPVVEGSADVPSFAVGAVADAELLLPCACSYDDCPLVGDAVDEMGVDCRSGAWPDTRVTIPMSACGQGRRSDIVLLRTDMLRLGTANWLNDQVRFASFWLSAL